MKLNLHLTDTLYGLSPERAHTLARRLGVYEGLHTWLRMCVPGCTEITDCPPWCPCEVELDLPEAEAELIEELIAA